MSSSSETVISVDNLGKRYRLGTGAQSGYSYRSLRETIATKIGGSGKSDGDSKRLFWALRGASFEISQGEKVGIIGRNGAGKSTLLKILARVTSPSEGRAETYGRIGSLLEVGSGFHPELTGRDNIFLNGAILGMRKNELRSKIDQIVEFAGVADFLDTPVKRYSSGMNLRLAFAVAAHLDHDILLIDEVLAVGDAEFQKKCLGRMEEMGKSGRTVLFVSHSTPAILRLCDRVILLDGGGVLADGPASQVVSKYLDSGLGTSAERVWEDPKMAPGDEVIRLKAVRVHSLGRVLEEIDIRQPVRIEVDYWRLAIRPELRPCVNLHFINDDGVLLFISTDVNNPERLSSSQGPGVVRSTCEIPGNFLAEGRHLVKVAVSTFNPTEVHAEEQDAVSFQVIDRSQGDGVRGEFANKYPGVVRPMFHWKVEKIEVEDYEQTAGMG